jgi:hypothetical protein
MNTHEFILNTNLIGLGFTIVAAAFFLIIRRQNIDKYRIRLEMIQKERLVAMEKGVPMPELPDYDNGHRATRVLGDFHPRWALGLGLILICGGIGMTLALSHSEVPFYNARWSMGLIPALVGVGFVLHYLVTRKNDG